MILRERRGGCRGGWEGAEVGSGIGMEKRGEDVLASLPQVLASLPSWSGRRTRPHGHRMSIGGNSGCLWSCCDTSLTYSLATVRY